MASGDGTPRTYTISTETNNGSVNLVLLTDEIGADVGITTALDYISASGDTLEVYFVSALGGSEITALDAVVGAHDGVSTITSFQFWEENPEETTTAETFQEVMARTAAAMSAGIYRLTWAFEMNVNVIGPLNSRGVGRFLVDGSVKNVVCQNQDMYCAYSGWDRYVAVEGETPELSIEIRRDPTLGGNDTIAIRKMKLGVEFMG